MTEHADTPASPPAYDDALELPYESTTLTLDIEPGPAPTRFTMEHWLWLYGRRHIRHLPMQLAPFPVPTQPGDVLRDQLVEWEIMDPTGQFIVPDAFDLLEKITHGWDFAVWGQTRFPSRTHLRHLDIPTEAEEWGLQEETEVTPRVPFLIAAHPKEVVTAASTPEALITSTTPIKRTRTADQEVAAALRFLLDPSDSWKPSTRPRIRVRREMVDAVAAHPVLGSVTGEFTDRDARQAVAELAEKFSLSPTAIDALTYQVTAPVAAITQWVAEVSTDTGTVMSQGGGGALVFHGDGTVTVTYPVTGSSGHPEVIFESATPEAVATAVTAVREDAVKGKRQSGVHDNPERSVWSVGTSERS